MMLLELFFYECVKQKVLMKENRYFNIIFLFLFFLPFLAHGHRPYEKIERVIETKQGEKISLIRSYWDGVFEVDPVKLEIRDECVNPIFETNSGRDVFVFCKEINNCFIFLFKGFFSIIPEEMYEIKDSEVSKIDTLWINLYGIVIPLIQDIKYYLLAVVFLFIPIMLCFYGVRQGIKKRYFRSVLLFFFGIILLFLWIYIVSLLSRLLFHLLVALIGIIIITLFALYKTVRKNNHL